MFYEKQTQLQKDNYKKMLTIIGNLTLLFSESDCPYLPYRAHENIFCKYLEAKNLARSDCSADASKNGIGVGLKTWMGNDDQKIAEFGKLRENYKSLAGIDLVKKIAEYRNERIRVTMNVHGIKKMIYHVVKRVPQAMQILECSFDYIDIDNISLISNRGNANNTYFTDKKHIYHFSVSKNTLYMIFSDLEKLDEFKVEILADPYTLLMNLTSTQAPHEIPQTYLFEKSTVSLPLKPQLCLRLYSTKADGTKFVPEKSGLNQWNARGRKRDPDELYIPYQAEDRNRDLTFFPPRDTTFNLHLPDGTTISAKVCQEADKNNPDLGKAVMSNPNKILGKWLLRDVFEVKEGTLITYEMLEIFGIDCVIFTKNSEDDYTVDFSEIGTYEEFYLNEK